VRSWTSTNRREGYSVLVRLRCMQHSDNNMEASKLSNSTQNIRCHHCAGPLSNRMVYFFPIIVILFSLHLLPISFFWFRKLVTGPFRLSSGIASPWWIILTHFGFFFYMYVGVRNFWSFFVGFEHFRLVLPLAARLVHFMDLILVYTLLPLFDYFLTSLLRFSEIKEVMNGEQLQTVIGK